MRPERAANRVSARETRPGANFEAVLESLSGDCAGDPRRPFGLSDLSLARLDRFRAETGSARRMADEYGLEDEAPATAQPVLPSDDADAIARELDLPSLSDIGGLRLARRRFMWANHPDRRPDLPRDLATRRVAVANMLIDRALGSPRRGR